MEIKGSVFKKFGKNNLFQMSNSGKMYNVIPVNGKNLDQHAALDGKFTVFCILMKEKRKGEIWLYKHSFTKIHFFCSRH